MIAGILDAHQLHEMHLAHLASLGWQPPQASGRDGDGDYDHDASDFGSQPPQPQQLPAGRAEPVTS